MSFGFSNALFVNVFLCLIIHTCRVALLHLWTRSIDVKLEVFFLNKQQRSSSSSLGVNYFLPHWLTLLCAIPFMYLIPSGTAFHGSDVRAEMSELTETLYYILSSFTFQGWLSKPLENSEKVTHAKVGKVCHVWPGSIPACLVRSSREWMCVFLGGGRVGWATVCLSRVLLEAFS